MYFSYRRNRELVKTTLPINIHDKKMIMQFSGLKPYIKKKSKQSGNVITNENIKLLLNAAFQFLSKTFIFFCILINEFPSPI